MCSHEIYGKKRKILSALHFHESMSVQQMVELLKSSPATVRRDIVRLEEEGEVERYWGGIRRKETPENRRRNTLQSQEPDEAHAAIGRLAASRLHDNELIFIGSGTTTLEMIPYIQNSNIHVITNGIPQLEALHRKRYRPCCFADFLRNIPVPWWERRPWRCSEAIILTRRFWGPTASMTIFVCFQRTNTRTRLRSSVFFSQRVHI